MKIYSVDEIINLSTPIFKKYKIKTCYLFGSYALGKADNKSDIDFLIMPPDNFTMIDIFNLTQDLEKLFNKEIDVISENAYTRDLNNEISDKGIMAKKLFYNNILNERKLIYY